MRILRFYGFINEEFSKNDPVPELNFESSLGIILLGSPGIGKSTFYNKFILPRKSDIKKFSTDDVSLTFTKDPNTYKEGASELNIRRLLKFIETGNSFVYDTTGTQEENIRKIIIESKKRGYKIIFIHLIGSKELATSGNLSRDRKVPMYYLDTAFGKQKKLMDIFSQLQNDNYYIVEREGSDYLFYKKIGDKILKRNFMGDWLEFENNPIQKY